MKADVFPNELELLEHELEDHEIESAKELGRAANRELPNRRSIPSSLSGNYHEFWSDRAGLVSARTSYASSVYAARCIYVDRTIGRNRGHWHSGSLVVASSPVGAGVGPPDAVCQQPPSNRLGNRVV